MNKLVRMKGKVCFLVILGGLISLCLFVTFFSPPLCLMNKIDIRYVYCLQPNIIVIDNPLIILQRGHVLVKGHVNSCNIFVLIFNKNS